MNNAGFGKTMENVRKTRIYQACNKWSKKELFSKRIKPSLRKPYSKIFFWKSISNSNSKTQIHMNKLVYLWLSILELSKIVIYEL